MHTRSRPRPSCSQNRPQADIDGVIAGLRAEGLDQNAERRRTRAARADVGRSRLVTVPKLRPRTSWRDALAWALR